MNAQPKIISNLINFLDSMSTESMMVDACQIIPSIDNNERLSISINCSANEGLKKYLQDLFESFNDLDIKQDHTTIHESSDFNSLDFVDKNKKIEIEITVPVDSPIFLDLDHFKRKWVRTQIWPEEFYLFEERQLINSKDTLPPEIKTINDVIEFSRSALSSIRKISHHHSSSGGAIFVDTEESAVPSIEIATEMKDIFITDSELLDKISVRHNFLDSIIDDSNSFHSKHKEIAVFRNSIFDFYKSIPEANTPLTAAAYLLTNFKKLEDIFSRNYQAFVGGLSLEKLRAEVVTEQTKFTDQATKNLLDTSSKMFALPGIALLSNYFSSGKYEQASNWSSSYLIVITCVILLLLLSVQLYQMYSLENSKDIVLSEFTKKLSGLPQDADVTKIQKNIDRMSITVCMTQGVLWLYFLLTLFVIAYIVVF